MGDLGCQTLGTQAQPIQFLHCEENEARYGKNFDHKLSCHGVITGTWVLLPHVAGVRKAIPECFERSGKDLLRLPRLEGCCPMWRVWLSLFCYFAGARREPACSNTYQDWENPGEPFLCRDLHCQAGEGGGTKFCSKHPGVGQPYFSVSGCSRRCLPTPRWVLTFLLLPICSLPSLGACDPLAERTLGQVAGDPGSA